MATVNMKKSRQKAIAGALALARHVGISPHLGSGWTLMKRPTGCTSAFTGRRMRREPLSWRNRACFCATGTRTSWESLCSTFPSVRLFCPHVAAEYLTPWATRRDAGTRGSQTRRRSAAIRKKLRGRKPKRTSDMTRQKGRGMKCRMKPEECVRNSILSW